MYLFVYISVITIPKNSLTDKKEFVTVFLNSVKGYQLCTELQT